MDDENQVRRAMDEDDWMHASDACQRWICADPENANAFYWLSSILLHQGRPLAALKASQTSVTLRGDDPGLLTQLAKCYLLVKEEKEADKVARRAAALEPGLAGDLDSLGVVFSHLGQHDVAVRLFHKAVAKDPENSHYHGNLGSALHFCNRSAEAEAVLDQAFALDPENHRARWSISQLKEQSDTSNHIGTLTDLLNRPGLSESAEIYLSLALSKEYEDLGQHALSFEHLARGNRIVLRKYPYDEAAEAQYFDNLHRMFADSLFRHNPKGFAARAPIFIIGLPRTGTTLLEQILGQHSEVLAAGELHTFNNEFSKICTESVLGLPGRNWQAAVANIDFAELGSRYMTNVRFRVGEASSFTDKYPLNYQLTGAIGLALPEARIIHVTRNPMDTCFSNYRQLFRLGSCRYSYDLTAMGRHYLRYRRLMTRWHEAMPGRILDIGYEDLVMQPESSIGKILSHCGLRWEDSCAQFRGSTRNVATASTAQVRHSMHQRNIGRWKHHADDLTDLVTLFRQNDILIGRVGLD